MYRFLGASPQGRGRRAEKDQPSKNPSRSAPEGLKERIINLH